MPFGLSLHIGLDFVDAAKYKMRLRLPYCSNDAKEMEALAASRGFDTRLLLNEDATALNFFHSLEDAASQLEANDILFISFSGHGGQKPDSSGDEEDGQDETLLFFDKEVLDDSLFETWTLFKKGVRILFICDSCHSGSVIKEPRWSRQETWFGHRLSQLVAGQDGSPRSSITSSIGNRSARTAQALQDIKASILLLSACKDDQTASSYGSKEELSLFTEVLLACWAGGRFASSYKDFHRLICQYMRPLSSVQLPRYMQIGRTHPSFEYQIPFTI